MSPAPFEATMTLDAPSLPLLDALYDSALDYMLGNGSNLDDLRALRAAKVSRRRELEELLTAGLPAPANDN